MATAAIAALGHGNTDGCWSCQSPLVVVEGWGIDSRAVGSECCSARRESLGVMSHCVHCHVPDEGGSVKGAFSLV